MIRILIADDQVLIAGALATMLGAQADMEVIATASNGREAVAVAESQPVDVAILDIRMPVHSGLEALPQVLRTGARVLILTTFNVPAYVEEAIAAGAHGFLLKDAEPEELIAAVRLVADGHTALSSEVTGHVVDAWRRVLTKGATHLRAEVQQGLSLLTPREVDVLKLIAAGLTNPEIADKLYISITTVKTHVSSLLAKLHCRDRVALVILAREAEV